MASGCESLAGPPWDEAKYLPVALDLPALAFIASGPSALRSQRRSVCATYHAIEIYRLRLALGCGAPSSFLRFCAPLLLSSGELALMVLAGRSMSSCANVHGTLQQLPKLGEGCSSGESGSSLWSLGRCPLEPWPGFASGVSVLFSSDPPIHR